MGDDDWDVRPDFKVEMTEQEQRWGSKLIPGSGHVAHIDFQALRDSVVKSDREIKANTGPPKASYGYGGKFDVEKDRMDKAAVGNDYREELSKHSSQKDYSKGFGGQYGVQKDCQDKSAVGYDYREEAAKHASQSSNFSPTEVSSLNKLRTFNKEREAPELHESQKPQKFCAGESSARSLRDKFESLAMENAKPIERPTRPIGKLNPVQMSTKPVEQAPVAVFQKTNQESPEPQIPTKEEHVDLSNGLTETKTPVEPEAPLEDSDYVNPIKDVDPEPLIDNSVPFIEHSQPEVLLENSPTLALSTCIALYDFDASQDDELTLRTRDVITDIDKFDKDWWHGRIGDRKGMFPSSYVAEVD